MFNGMNGLEILKNWPRYDSGELVGFGDDVSRHGGDFEANVVALYRDGSFSLNFWAYSKGERVKRVKRPSVLASDGEPLEVGQTVWEVGVETTTPMTVIDVDSDLTRCEYTWTDGKVRKPCLPPDQLTHQRPVLAADGEPLEVGQTVWHVGNGVEFTVIGLPNPGEYQAVKLRLDDGAFTGLDPDQLTHQRPVLDADGVPIKVGDTVWDIETGCGRTVRAVNDNETVEFDGYENRGWFGKFLTHQQPEPPDSWERLYSDMYNGLIPKDKFMRRCKALAERGE